MRLEVQKVGGNHLGPMPLQVPMVGVVSKRRTLGRVRRRRRRRRHELRAQPLPSPLLLLLVAIATEASEERDAGSCCAGGRSTAVAALRLPYSQGEEALEPTVLLKCCWTSTFAHVAVLAGCDAYGAAEKRILCSCASLASRLSAQQVTPLTG